MKNLYKNFLLPFLVSLVLAASALPSFAASLTDYGENVLADSLFRGTQYSATAPATYYVALYTTACSDSAPGTEVAVGSYARASIGRSLSAWTGTQGTAGSTSSGTNGTVGNAASVTFPAATADWGTVTYWGIFDAATGGNAIICAPMTSARSITNGSTASFGAGALTVQIDN